MWGARGGLRIQRGDRAGAIADLERSLQLEPRGPTADLCREHLRRLGAPSAR